MPGQSIKKEALFTTLPKPRNTNLLVEIQAERKLKTDTIIVLEDDPTGTQTVSNVSVKGQIINGVPVWELGEETKFPNSHQIIFTGNVGYESSLTEVVEKLML